jgi:hypothetical protein
MPSLSKILGPTTASDGNPVVAYGNNFSKNQEILAIFFVSVKCQMIFGPDPSPRENFNRRTLADFGVLSG